MECWRIYASPSHLYPKGNSLSQVGLANVIYYIYYIFSTVCAKFKETFIFVIEMIVLLFSRSVYYI
jgi:hypothetical protein